MAYEMRPNKTNFGLSFGYFWEKKCEEERRREEQEKKKRKGMELYGTCMELGLRMETLSMEVFLWILVVPFLGFS